MRRWFLIVVAVNLVAIGALVFIYPNLMVSPGPLQTGHAALATDCFACHRPLLGASADRCVTCHAVSDIGLKTTKGVTLVGLQSKPPFHQQLTSQACTTCHIGHEGSTLAAGRQKSFSHDLLQPSVRGQCATCHTAPETDFHHSAGATCSQCHNQTAWKPTTFDHAKLFALEGPHNTPCVTCHIDQVFTKYTCYGCHEHQPDQIRAKHVREGIRDFQNCVQCHRSAHGGESGERGERGEGSRGERERD